MNKYTTNKFCQLCGVSRKQLRYYEERGILSQVPRSGSNNYRYYTQEHIYEIVAAKGLKNMDMSLAEMKDVIYGASVGSVQLSMQKQLNLARENLETSLRQYEQSAIAYARLVEALSLLKLQRRQDAASQFEVVDRPQQDVIALSYASTFEDEACCDVEYLPQIQTAAQEVNTTSFGALLYLTYGHFDPDACLFDRQVHDFKIAVPVLDRKKPSPLYHTIPPFRGVSAIHIGSPKEERLYHTYMDLLTWAREQGYPLENWSVEEWLISPMVTNNKDLWMIQIVIPIRE